MATLKQVRLTNCQSLKSCVYDLREQGLTRLEGPNSSGKSIMVKMILWTMDNKINSPKTRAGLISKSCSYCEATYVRSDDCELTIHLTVDASTTWVSLTYPGQEPIVRYLADRNYRELCFEFGFHYDDNRGISINIGQGSGAILFFGTNGPTNSDIVKVAITDSYAENVLRNLTETTQEARRMQDRSISNAMVLENALGELKVYDTEKLADQLGKLERYFNILSTVYIPELPVIVPVPRVKFLEVYNPILPEIKYPRIIDTSKFVVDIPDVAPIRKEIEVLKSNVCPTCGRSF